MENSLTVYIDFSNDSAPSPGDKLISTEVFLGRRVAAKIFQPDHLLSKIDVSTSCEFSTIMTAVGKQFLRTHNSKPITLVLLLDECNVVIDELGEDYFRAMLRSIGGYMCSSTTQQAKSIQDGIILVPVVAGTIAQSLESSFFKVTQYASFTLPVPLLQESHINSIVKSPWFAQTAPSALPFMDNPIFSRLACVYCVLPRGMEYFVDAAKQLDISDRQTLQQFEKNIQRALLTAYQPKRYLETLGDFEQYFLEISLARFPIVSSDLTNHLESQGILFRESDGSIYLPYPILQQLSNKIQVLLPDLSSDLKWDDFEELMLILQSIRLRALIRSQIARPTLSLLFGELLGQGGNTEFVLPTTVDLQAHQERRQTMSGIIRYDVPRTYTSMVHPAVHCKTGNPKLDAFLQLPLAQGSLFVWEQYKSTNASVNQKITGEDSITEWLADIKSTVGLPAGFYLWMTNKNLSKNGAEELRNLLESEPSLLVMTGQEMKAFLPTPFASILHLI
eukprot:TRINITY_DN580_c0_g1_i2.p1 TRINITY_DN580_c0_g1~~TRINITY_DN580_c0_g1_i2.p1  ORF type:complete len:505 (-),score=70.80 TRINITY_DN580_c0_g1_i2:27-1541(-)